MSIWCTNAQILLLPLFPDSFARRNQKHHEEKPRQISESARQGDQDPAGAECVKTRKCRHTAGLHRKGPQRLPGDGGECRFYI